MDSGYFMGIDPGQTGGAGIVNLLGEYVATWRWDKLNPSNTYNNLLRYKEGIRNVYIESVRIFPRAGLGHATQGQSLLINSGIWQGWLIALGLHFALINPATWQARHGLTRWKTRPGGPSPLTLARSLWPAAPLQYQADDGKAVGLLLADLARREIIHSQTPKKHLNFNDKGCTKGKGRGPRSKRLNRPLNDPLEAKAPEPFTWELNP